MITCLNENLWDNDDCSRVSKWSEAKPGGSARLITRLLPWTGTHQNISAPCTKRTDPTKNKSSFVSYHGDNLEINVSLECQCFSYEPKLSLQASVLVQFNKTHTSHPHKHTQTCKNKRINVTLHSLFLTGRPCRRSGSGLVSPRGAGPWSQCI